MAKTKKPKTKKATKPVVQQVLYSDLEQIASELLKNYGNARVTAVHAATIHRIDGAQEAVNTLVNSVLKLINSNKGKENGSKGPQKVNKVGEKVQKPTTEQPTNEEPDTESI